jgi:hypothetical protein
LNQRSPPRVGPAISGALEFQLRVQPLHWKASKAVGRFPQSVPRFSNQSRDPVAVFPECDSRSSQPVQCSSYLSPPNCFHSAPTKFPLPDRASFQKSNHDMLIRSQTPNPDSSGLQSSTLEPTNAKLCISLFHRKMQSDPQLSLQNHQIKLHSFRLTRAKGFRLKRSTVNLLFSSICKLSKPSCRGTAENMSFTRSDFARSMRSTNGRI